MSLVTKTYGPCGSDHTLQQEITMLMHTIVMKNGQYTLSELGYLNMNTITYVEDHIEVKIFFAPELAVVAGKTIQWIQISDDQSDVEYLQWDSVRRKPGRCCQL